MQLIRLRGWRMEREPILFSSKSMEPKEGEFMNNGQKLAGRKALVTGSGTGIGREIALEFARQGADVVLHYSQNREGAASAAEEIKAMGRRAEVFGADFSDLDQVLALANHAVESLGSINCLVNNSGITFNRPFLKMKPEHFDKLFNVNVRAQYFITQRIVQDMLEHGGGTICNISSIHGLQGAPEHTAYAATKGAIIAYTRTLGVELAHRGIRVNGIAPGWVTVENYFTSIPGFNEADAKKSAENSVPVARYGLPIDVAHLATFLCGDDAGFLIGQTIVLDGGTVSLMSLISDFRTESTSHFGERYVLTPKGR
jgi:NAD(P)-dependent dehydrogenase (short-subunit alcohol dehydrogenase family)